MLTDFLVDSDARKTVISTITCGPPTFCCWAMRLRAVCLGSCIFSFRASNDITHGSRLSRFMSGTPPPSCAPAGVHNRNEWHSCIGLDGVAGGQLRTACERAAQETATRRTTMTKLPISPAAQAYQDARGRRPICSTTSKVPENRETSGRSTSWGGPQDVVGTLPQRKSPLFDVTIYTPLCRPRSRARGWIYKYLSQLIR